MGRQKKYGTETEVITVRIEKVWAEVIRIIPKISKEYYSESEIIREAILNFLNEQISSELLEKAISYGLEKGTITSEEMELLNSQ